MIKRTLEISRAAAHLALRHDQLILKRDGQIIGQMPCEDLGVVLVDHPQATYTHAALTKLAACGATVVLCGSDHLPAALVLPLADHSEVVWRLREQLSISRPLVKQLWKQLVAAKICAQARNLDTALSAHRKLLALSREVRSGDPTNIEAQAARIYWRHWLAGATEHTATNFRRDPDADGLNAVLNYGYAVLRAATGRAIVAAGLLPSLGIHHRHRANAFCLADDLMEPLRPLVDKRVREIHRDGCNELQQYAKERLLQLLVAKMRLGRQTGPLMVMLHRMVASLVRCYQGETKRLEIPISCESQDTG